MRKRFTLIAFMLAVICLHGNAQDRVLSGKINSPDDTLGIPGVTVEVKGTSVATSTDINGRYTIRIPPGATTLRFSAVGMRSQEVPIGTSETLNITMEPDLVKLDEVVVTALGIERESRSLGYSTTQVSGEQVVESGEVNVVSGLSGKVSGIQVTSSAGVPGASAKILLRGARSFIGDNQPLFVIDGIPLDNQTREVSGRDYPFNNFLEQVNYGNRAIDINPDDVESINVLKGPAAAVLYGERGANGAIIITTKKAKYGQKTEVAISSSFQWDEVNKLPDLQDKYAQGDGGVYNTYNPGPDGIWNTADDNPGTVSSWGPTISSLGLSPVDNPGNFFRTGNTFTNNISVSTGTERNSYRLSIGHTGQTGIVPNTDFKRLSARLTAQSQLRTDLSLTSTVNVITDGAAKAQQGSNTSGVMLALLRAPSSYDLRDGESSGWERPEGSFFNYYPFYDNPYWTAANNTFDEKTTRLIASFALNYFPVDWLKLTWRPGMDTYETNAKSIFAVGSNNSTQTLLGQIGINSFRHQEIYNDLIATINRKLGEKFTGTLTIGNNVSQRIDYNQYSRGRNLAIPKFYNMGNASDLYADEFEERRRSVSFFAQLDFSFNDYLFLGFTGRQEWSSTFGSNQRSFFYPGVNAAFVFTGLEPLKDKKVLSFGKIRAAYATASTSPEPYSSITVFEKPFFTDGFTNGFAFPYNGVNGYGIAAIIGNPDLEPEQTSGPEAGIELKFFKDRIDLDFTWYSLTSKNIIMERPVPYSSGHAAMYDNAGEIRNSGIEIELQTIPVRSGKFEWGLGGNFAMNENEVLALAPGIDEFEIEVGFGDPGVFAVVGGPYGALYGTTWERHSNGEILIDEDGFPVISTILTEVGNPYPDWTAGIRNVFKFGDLTLNTLIDIRQGGEIWNGTQARLNRIGMAAETEDRERQFIVPGVHADGTPNTTPIDAVDYWGVYLGDFGATEQSIQDASSIRLREVSLSYIFRKLKVVKTLEVSVMGRNLWLSTDYMGVDPETSLTGAGSNYSGVDWFVMPNTRSYAVTVRASF